MAKDFHKKTDGEKLYVFIYYAGHGAMLNYTKLMINEEDYQDRFFNLEEKINILSNSRKNTFFTTVFDCCREAI
jgi:hypothetical protein